MHSILTWAHWILPIHQVKKKWRKAKTTFSDILSCVLSYPVVKTAGKMVQSGDFGALLASIVLFQIFLCFTIYIAVFDMCTVKIN